MFQESSYEPNYFPYIGNGMIILLALMSISSSFFMMTSGWEKNLSDYDSRTPTISLSNIEKMQNFEMDDSLRNNYISYDWTELAPSIYDIYERGVVEGKMWRDQSGEYSPSLSTEYYHLRFGFLGDKMIKELAEKALEFYRFEPIHYQELLDTNFDKAIFIQVKETQMFIASLDDQVIYIRYRGYEDLRAYFDHIYDNMINFNKR